MTDGRRIAARVSTFYEAHPYPPPVDDLDALPPCVGRRAAARRVPPLLARRTATATTAAILVAGCGTVQAAHYAVRWPNAKIVGIDVSAKSHRVHAAT